MHLPEFLVDGNCHNLFNFTGDELKEVAKKYKTQTPILWYASGLCTDVTFLLLLAVGVKHNFPYVLYLNDDYSRRRIDWEGSDQQRLLKNEMKQSQDQDDPNKKATATFTEERWLKSNKHTLELLNSNVSIVIPQDYITHKDQENEIAVLDKIVTDKSRISEKDRRCMRNAQVTREDLKGTNNKFYSTPTIEELLRCAVVEFTKRMMGRFYFAPTMRFNGSLEITARYFHAATKFVSSLMHQWEDTALCPFQVKLPHKYKIQFLYNVNGCHS